MSADRRRAARAATSLAFLCLACRAPVAAPPAGMAPRGAERPNIVWIVADDMSADVGAYGDRWAITPNIDRLAAEGARYDNAFSVSGVCAPSRSALITGVHPTTLGSQHMRSWAVPPPEVRAFPELLRRAGYYTANNQKTDYNLTAYATTPRESPGPKGADIARAVREPPVGAWDDSSGTAHWRNRPDPGQPFFAVFDLFVTHESRIRFADDAFAEATADLSGEERHDPADAELPPYYPDTPRVRSDWARYYDLVTAADHQVGELLRQLDEDGLRDDTVVLFFADHGRGLPRAKRWLYDSGIRVPLVVRWPGHVAPGSVSEELVSFVDFAPTLLALAGAERPSYLQGRVFLGAATEPEPSFVFAARGRMDETMDRIRAVRDRRFKYLRNFEPQKPWSQPIAYMDEMPTMQELRRLSAAGELDPVAALFMAASKPEEELYDLAADPHEVVNLAADPAQAERLSRMRGALERWIAESGDLGELPEAELIDRMRAPGLETRTADVLATPPAGTYEGPVEVGLSCPTPGAVIEVALDEPPGSPGRWTLYDRPIRLDHGTRLRARAGRLGYLASPELEADYSIAAEDP